MSPNRLEIKYFTRKEFLLGVVSGTVLGAGLEHIRNAAQGLVEAQKIPSSVVKLQEEYAKLSTERMEILTAKSWERDTEIWYARIRLFNALVATYNADLLRSRKMHTDAFLQPTNQPKDENAKVGTTRPKRMPAHEMEFPEPLELIILPEDDEDTVIPDGLKNPPPEQPDQKPE